MFVSGIFSIMFLLPYSLQAVSYESSEDNGKHRQRFPKVRTNNHIHSSEHHKYHVKDTERYKHYVKHAVDSSEEKSEECRCTCENCTEKSCCDNDLCNECILQQSSVMIIPYNYPYVMPQYNMVAGASPATIQNTTTTEAPTTPVTQRLPASPVVNSFKSEERIVPSAMAPFYRPEEGTASSQHKRQQDLTEQEIIRNYILSKIHEEKLHATMTQMNAETVRDLQKTPPRKVDKSIFKGGADYDDERGGNPYEDVERLLQYVKRVRKEKLRPEMKDIQG